MICQETEIYNQIMDIYTIPDEEEKSISIYRKIIGLMKMWKKANLLGDFTDETAEIMIKSLLLCIGIIRNGKDFTPNNNSNVEKKKIKKILVKLL
jgi:hypothetical protein